MTEAIAASAPVDDKIGCRECGARCHSIQIHLKEHHPEMSLADYQAKHPDSPVLSDFARRALESRRARDAMATVGAAASAAPVAHLHAVGEPRIEMKSLADVFGFGSVPAAKNQRGEPIMIQTFSGLDPDSAAMVPSIDHNYVFNIDLVKTALIALTLNKPAYFWGYHGTGKTSIWEQVCARTGRPFMRLQHTVDTEGAHIYGQYVVKDGATEFQLGPLPMAMMKGWVFCADEYDFALPSVLSVYQAVLEGKPLFIKEAPPHLRIIRPHPAFRIVGTGNTNGGGDETGLYQGTQIQNAANYSRWLIVKEVGYMERKIESAIVQSQSGIDRADADKLIKVANDVREAFKNGKISTTISPRELINAAQLGVVLGSNWREAMKLAFTSRLSRVDREIVDQVLQRVFG